MKLKLSMELSSIEVIKRFVRINAGLSIVPEIAVREEVEASQLHMIEIREFDEHVSSRMGVLYRKDRYLTLAARRFLEDLEAWKG